MTKTQYYTATTLDGYIAGPGDSLDWLFTVEGGADEFAPYFADVGAFAMGASTYEWILRHDRPHEDPEKWTGPYGSVPCWVFTHRELPVIPGADIRFVRGDVRPVHAEMTEAAAGRNIWIVGGGELAGTFADHGLLDELLLSVAPVFLTEGAPLLPRRLLSEDLRLTGVRQASQFAVLTYELVRQATS
ncbi:dihydrofolate reductase family protein [Longispora albida]|uniref:dihydrofolate reductase family protein n=1 Tax=Longispora albida TaxID=203523 RepID=UPI0003791613|nr:dihydrofolate reductase family protein [Longispora albida]